MKIQKEFSLTAPSGSAVYSLLMSLYDARRNKAKAPNEGPNTPSFSAVGSPSPRIEQDCSLIMCRVVITHTADLCRVRDG